MGWGLNLWTIESQSVSPLFGDNDENQVEVCFGLRDELLW